MLESIGDVNLGVALKLLQQGFPHRSSKFWEDRVRRISSYNRHSGESSIGKLLLAAGKPVGIALEIVDQSRLADGKLHKIVNLSSWYVDPTYRHQAALMLRDLVREEDVVYTDLTPSDRVVPMLPLLGFKPLNSGIAAVALPSVAFGSAGGAEVVSLAEAKPGAISPETRSRLERNIEAGAIGAVLTGDNVSCPLLFVPRKLRRVPVAQLIYCEDNALLGRCLSPIARYLMKKGKLGLVIDIPLNHRAPGIHFLRRGLKFAKGGCFDNRTDYAGSELLIVGL
jgi:hypothetical protein